MLKGIYDGMIMDMKPNHEEILWLIEQAEKLEEAQTKLNGIRGVIEILSSDSDEQKLQSIKDILDNPNYDGF